MVMRGGSRRPKKYHVEAYHGDPLDWRTVFGAWDTSRMFCEGWVAAMDSLYPSRPHRIVATYADGSIDVIRETKGRAKVHTN